MLAGGISNAETSGAATLRKGQRARRTRQNRLSFPTVPARASGTLRPVLLGLVLSISLSDAGFAQSVAPPTREELQIGNQPGSMVPQSRLSVDGDIERGPCPFDNPSFAQVRVNFSNVAFANLPGIDAQSLDNAWRDLAGRDLPVSTLCEIRDRAATMLRRMGYLAAVQIPPQRIEAGGEVRMDILAARLVEVQLRGTAGNAERLISAHLAKLAREEWFNIHEAERHLLLLEDLPGYDVRLTLRSAGRGPGEVIGDVLVTRRPIEVLVGTQNLAARVTGREGMFAQVTLNGLTGLGDRTTVSLYNTVQTREQTILQINHDFALGSDGLRLGASLIRGRSRPDFANGAFRTKTLIGRAGLSYPLIRRQHFTLGGATGVEMIDQSVDFGAVRLSKDKLRIAYAQINLEAIDKASLYGNAGFSASEPRWRAAALAEARFGIDGLGASDRCLPIARCLPPNVPISNLAADPSALVLRLEANLEYRPVPSVTLAVAPRLQYASKQLLGFEKFSLGNYTIGRGYDPGAVLGDKGAGASFELRLGKLQPRSPKGVAIQPYGFFDVAWAWTNDNGLSRDPARIHSAGGGLRARLGNHLNANVLFAVPLERIGVQARRGDTRVLFTITARAWPWK